MKKAIPWILLILLFLTLIFSVNITDKITAKAIVSSDFSKITYNGQEYVQYILTYEEILNLPDFDKTPNIPARVEDEPFLLSIMSTEIINISEDGKYIKYTSDYDNLQSYYYKRVS